MTTNSSQKHAKKYVCDICYFSSCNKYDYDRHLATIKHKNNILTTEDNNNLAKHNKTYDCKNCYKIFNDRAGLWRHNKKCLNNASNDLIDKNIILELIKQNTDIIKENSEFKQLMLEQNKTMIEMAKNQGNKLIHSNSHNTNNNNFNLNFYLNETCKNAMNIMDFVNQLPVSIKNLEDTSRLGFAEGISKIFIDGLKKIQVSDRPIHCSDLKRETLYIKDNNEWNKETDNRVILTNAIKHVANKNMKQISEWTKIHPDYNDYQSKENDKYLKIVCEAMSGSSVEESTKNYSKIARNIIRETVIDKNVDTV